MGSGMSALGVVDVLGPVVAVCAAAVVARATLVTFAAPAGLRVVLVVLRAVVFLLVVLLLLVAMWFCPGLIVSLLETP
jgi:hypothetical protein